MKNIEIKLMSRVIDPCDWWDDMIGAQETVIDSKGKKKHGTLVF